MKTAFKITHAGSRYTKSYFRNENKDTVIVTTWLESGMYGHNALTYFKHSVEVIKYKCRTRKFKYASEDVLDNRYKEYITEQQLYEAYHNHWNKLNPLRYFSKGSVNSDILIKDDIIILEVSKEQKTY